MITETYADKSLRDLCYLLILKRRSEWGSSSVDYLVRPELLVIAKNTKDQVWYTAFGTTVCISQGLASMLCKVLGVAESLKFRSIKGIPVEYREYR